MGTCIQKRRGNANQMWFYKGNISKFIISLKWDDKFFGIKLSWK